MGIRLGHLHLSRCGPLFIKTNRGPRIGQSVPHVLGSVYKFDSSIL